MYLQPMIACCLAVISISSLGYADEKGEQLAKKYPVLARLTPTQEKLPPNCKAQEIPDDIPELKGLKNLAITTETKHFCLLTNVSQNC
jgi:hypothetical protein